MRAHSVVGIVLGIVDIVCKQDKVLCLMCVHSSWITDNKWVNKCVLFHVVINAMGGKIKQVKAGQPASERSSPKILTKVTFGHRPSWCKGASSTKIWGKRLSNTGDDKY